METIAIIAAIRQYIVAESYAMADNWFSCIKQRVYAVLVTAEGECHYGANWMTVSDIDVCPRVTQGRKDYELCATICGQGTEFHAERQAIWSTLYSGASTVGASIYIVGHTYCCETCIAGMVDAGVSFAGSLDSGKTYNF